MMLPVCNAGAGGGSIPKIIHFVWIGSALPDWAAYNIKQWESLNPDFEIMLHDESILLPELKPAFDAAMGPSSQSDLLRYSAMKKHGGWYIDVDFWAFRPLQIAIDGWQLDGSRFFISKQQGHKAGEWLPYNATPIACTADHPALDIIIKECIDVEPIHRVAYGPRLMKKVVRDNPELFEIAEPGWFFPLSIEQCKNVVPYLKHHAHRIDLYNSGTAGQLPIAAHLWAESVDMDYSFSIADQVDARPVAVVQDVVREDHPLNAIAQGLETLGYNVRRANKPIDDRVNPLRPDLVVIWNGRRYPEWPEYAAEQRAQTIMLEHGFFDRQQYTQVDSKGFLHTASWRKTINETATARGKDLIDALVPNREPIKARNDGYILVLGQVSGDTQLMDSEITGPAPLHRIMSRYKPAHVKAFFRPHPLRASYVGKNWPNVPLMPIEAQEQGHYLKNKSGNELHQAIAGARFVVAINSNALNEAIALGCPAMAFGPMLGIDAGAVKQCSESTIKQDLDDMMGGWCPDQKTVDNYLAQLADHQYSLDELRDTKTLKSILALYQINHLSEAAS